MASVPSSTSIVRHGRRRAYSDESLDQPSAPIDAGRRGEAIGGDLTIGDLVGDDLWPINRHTLFCVTDGWVPVDRGPRLSVYVVFDFLIYFSRFECMFQKFISRASSVQMG